MNFKYSKIIGNLLVLVTLALGGCATNTVPDDTRIAPRTNPDTIRSPASKMDTKRRAPQSIGQTTSEHQCLALAMYWEARGEGRVGMQAVGEVVLNRVEDRRFPATACAVVKQGGETPPCQFSWWCDGRSDHPTDRDRWQDALQVVDIMKAGRNQDLTDGALFFHSTAVRPNWTYQRVARIGNHVFYK